MANDWGGGHEEYVGKHRKEPGCPLVIGVALLALALMVLSL